MIVIDKLHREGLGYRGLSRHKSKNLPFCVCHGMALVFLNGFALLKLHMNKMN